MDFNSVSISILPFISLPYILPTLLTLICVISLIKQWKKPAGNLPPSPPGLPIIGSLHQLGKVPHQSLWELSKKYGPVMFLRLGQIPTLVVSSPEMAKQVMKTHDLECCSRPDSYGTNKLSYNFLDVAFSPYNAYWKEVRKLCVVELFTVSRVQSFSHVRDAQVSRLIDFMSLNEGQSINLSEKFFDHINEIVCQIAFGRRYEGNQFENASVQEVVSEVFAMLSGFWAADFFPTFGWIIDMLMGLHKRLNKAFKHIDGLLERVIEDHLKPGGEHLGRNDIVDVLLGQSRDQTGPVRLTRNHIKALLMDIYLGGLDTSAVTIAWAMTELMKNPRVMKKVQTEIRSVIGKKPKVNENEMDNLPYFKMVVKETFRLHPPATLLVPRQTMKHCKIGGYDVNPKTRMLVGVWAIGRDPNTWKNPEEFYPERFEESDIDFKGAHFELVPFGAGRRMCPAMAMGAAMIELTLANLLHCFDWELPPGMKIEDLSMEEEAGLTAHRKVPLFLVPIKYKWD